MFNRNYDKQGVFGINWIEVLIETSINGLEPLCGRLLAIGINGFVINDPEEFGEFLEHKSTAWDYIEDDLLALKTSTPSVTVYIADNEQGKDTLTLLREQVEALRAYGQAEHIDFGALSVELKNVKEADWADNWKQYFKPLKIGEKLLIKPSWETLPDDQTAETRKVLEIDPGSSFGTGQHHTTKLCMELLEGIVKNGDNILDLGCGSGILGIAAVLLGASYVRGVDIDENCVRVAGENFEKNNIDTDKFTLDCGNIIGDSAFAETIKTDGGYDIITANIVADVLIAMSGIFGNFLKASGKVIISGIISERADEVFAAMTEKHFVKINEHESGGWVAAVFERKE
jgi:ribosomal protein L11 methyltransferase